MQAKSSTTAERRQPPPQIDAAPSLTSKSKTAIWILLSAGSIIVAGYYTYDRYIAYEQHKAGLAFCSEAELAIWQERVQQTLGQFDRASKAASVAPRIALAPLILRLSEARAEVDKVPPPPPCAAEALKLLRHAMVLREDAFLAFARQEGQTTVSAAMYEAERESEAAISKLAEVRAKAVK